MKKSMRALTIPQPHAEAIMRGKKLVDYRSGATTVRGRIYIYASPERLAPDDEAAWLGEYGIDDMFSDELPRGVIVGTVELCDCTDNGREFSWHFMNPERATELLAPKNKPMGIWFNPF
jgi:ASCH domain